MLVLFPWWMDSCLAVLLLDSFLNCSLIADDVHWMFATRFWGRFTIVDESYFFRSVETRIPEDLPMAGWKKNQLLNCLLKASLLLQFQPFLWIDCFKVWEIYFTELDGLSEGGEKFWTGFQYSISWQISSRFNMHYSAVISRFLPYFNYGWVAILWKVHSGSLTYLDAICPFLRGNTTSMFTRVYLNFRLLMIFSFKLHPFA